MFGRVLELLLPQACIGCGHPGARLCDPCLGIDPARRMPRPAPRGLPACWSAAPYDGAVRRAIVAYKERGEAALAAVLADALAYTLTRAIPTGPLSVVPVPSARKALRARGHDPVGALAALAVRRLGERARLLP
ncbi:MAG: ComF family protein, partial [Nonomuraea sp.]|nr:ComF family protein [Nonomuraea sp.]